jgi:hypothetical protein
MKETTAEEKTQLKKRLEECVCQMEGYKVDSDKLHWDKGIGVLVSVNEAKLFISYLATKGGTEKEPDIIKFGAYLTGHDEETIIQMFKDWRNR